MTSIPINSIVPNGKTLASRTYPLLLYVKEKKAEDFPQIWAYIKEFTGEDAIGSAGYLTQKGLIPMPEERGSVRGNKSPKNYC